MKLLKKLAKLTTLSNRMSNNMIFCLCTGAGDVWHFYDQETKVSSRKAQSPEVERRKIGAASPIHHNRL
jgi:hypothetical protein